MAITAVIVAIFAASVGATVVFVFVVVISVDIVVVTVVVLVFVVISVDIVVVTVVIIAIVVVIVTQPQSPQLAEPLWTDPGLKSGISVRKLIST